MFVVGIDEAGRGPLAGPVAVGAVMVPVDFDWTLVPGVGDSKQLSPENREAIFRRATYLRHHRQLNFSVAFVGAGVIDRFGISFAINTALARALRRLDVPVDSREPRDERWLLPVIVPHSTLKLDGGLRAPSCYLNQETIIKGDVSEPTIGLASIVAKVLRDRYMLRVARRYPRYNFDQHMGYGTKAHRQMLGTYGLCPIHRVSYCQNVKLWGKM